MPTRDSDVLQIPGAVQLPSHSINPTRETQAVLLEVDVTRARRWMRAQNRGSADSVTFVAWLVRSIACSLQSDRNEVPCTDRSHDAGVSVTVLVDRTVDSVAESVVFPLEIPQAAGRAVNELASLIRTARSTAIEPAEFVTGRRTGFQPRVFNYMPQFAQRALVRRAVRRAALPRRVPGDVLVTSAGLGGRAKGWFVPTTQHPVSIGVGAVAPKAVVLNGAIHRREVFHMALVLDMTTIDREYASRWVSRLLRTMEQPAELSLN